MENDAAKYPEENTSRPDGWSWVGVLLPGIAWGAQLEALYLTSDYGCELYQYQYNHLVSIIGLVITLACILIAWRGYSNAAGREPMTLSIRDARFLNLVGLGMSTLFTALIFAQWLPTLTGVPCGK